MIEADGDGEAGTVIISADGVTGTAAFLGVRPADLFGHAGDIVLFGGDGANNEVGGQINIAAGVGDGGDTIGATLEVLPGQPQHGGDIVLTPGVGGPIRNGLVVLVGIPTSNPGVSGALWNDSGVLKISAG